MSHNIFSFLCFVLKLNGFWKVLFLLEDSNLIMIESCPSGGLLMPLKVLTVSLQQLFLFLIIKLFGSSLKYNLQDPTPNLLKDSGNFFTHFSGFLIVSIWTLTQARCMNAHGSNYHRRLYLALAHPWETEVSLSSLADGSVDLHTTSCLSQINA